MSRYRFRFKGRQYIIEMLGGHWVVTRWRDGDCDWSQANHDEASWGRLMLEARKLDQPTE